MKKDDELSPELRRVAREGGTEAPFAGKYVDNHEPGVFKCAVCGEVLFGSDAKFDSGTGWPSFTAPAEALAKEGGTASSSIELREDISHGMRRTEVRCKNCKAHLGHVFDDGPIDGRLPTDRQGKRYCINSVCLELEKKE